MPKPQMIRTLYDPSYPFPWVAHRDGWKPGDPVGKGGTEDEAIEDLLQLEEGYDASAL